MESQLAYRLCRARSFKNSSMVIVVMDMAPCLEKMVDDLLATVYKCVLEKLKEMWEETLRYYHPAPTDDVRIRFLAITGCSIAAGISQFLQQPFRKLLCYASSISSTSPLLLIHLTNPSSLVLGRPLTTSTKRRPVWNKWAPSLDWLMPSPFPPTHGGLTQEQSRECTCYVLIKW